MLVTGGAGFLGSHLCEKLLKTSKVICLDNLISSHIRNIEHLLKHPDFVFIKHDIVQPVDLEQFPELKKYKIKFQGLQEIYHLACPTSPKKFDQVKIQTLMCNAYGTINALELARKHQSKFLFTSSSVIYGPRAKNRTYFKESDFGFVNLLSQRSCYDEGKRFAESAVVTYRDVYNLDAKIARLFRTYGPRMALHDGQMIPDFIVDALENKDLVIYGDETFTTSLCYVDDMIDGILKIMESKEQGPINLGDPQVFPIADVAEKIIKMTKSKSKVVFDAPLLFMTPLGLPDITLAKDILHWLPVTKLEDGLQKTIDYTKAHKELLGL